MTHPLDAESMCLKEHLAFSDKVQTHACQIAGDLHSLFPKKWSKAVSFFMHACALTNNKPLVGRVACEISQDQKGASGSLLLLY